MSRFILGFVVLCLLYIYADAQRIIDCGPDSVPAKCGKCSEPTCRDQREKMCKVSANCPMQCRCRENLYRNEETGQCVTKEECPKNNCAA